MFGEVEVQPCIHLGAVVVSPTVTQISTVRKEALTTSDPGNNPVVEQYLANHRFVAFDLETTGINVQSDLPVSVAISEIAHGVSVRQRYNIIDPGVPIPPGATVVHGITDEVAQQGGIPLLEAISDIVSELMNASDENKILVGMNLTYDLSLVDYCARALLGRGLVEMGFDAPVLDVLVLDRQYVPRRYGKRTLDRLCAHYGVDGIAFHNALSDAQASFLVLREMLKRFPSITEIALSDVNRRLEEYQHRWARDFNEWRRREGLSEIEIWSWPIESRLI